VSDSNESGDGRASAKEAVGELSKKLGAKRRMSLPSLPHLPWVTILQVAAIRLVVVPVLWVVTYRFVQAPGTLLMAQRWMQGETIRHQNVKFTDMSPNIVRAVLAAEDARFCAHDGFDMKAIQDAYAQNQKASNVAKGKVRGGSTISQQVAKNLFLWPDRSFVRKGMEVYFTFLAEHLWDKKRILEAYLNAAEWGDGVFGIQAAAQARFKVSAGELSPRQAALLAAVLPSPNRWSATAPGPYVLRRAATIQARMAGVRAQGLDTCVLGAYAGPPRQRGPVKPLPPLEALPPDVAAEAEAPVMAPDVEPVDASAVDPLMTPTISDGQLEAPAATEEAAPVSASPPQ
jgi:monofunctional biosynthetic peptidoglycan transglycosylase